MKKLLNVIVAIISIALVSCCFMSCGDPADSQSEEFSISSAPANVTVSMSAKANTVKLIWDAATSNGTVSYNVYYGTTNVFSSATKMYSNASGTEVSVTLPSLLEGADDEDDTKTQSYFFFVEATAGSSTAVSDAKEFDVVFSQLPAPTNVTYTKTESSGTVSYTVDWTDASNVDGYQVYMKKNSSSEWEKCNATQTGLNSSVYGEAAFAVASYQNIGSELRSSKTYNFGKKILATSSQE